MAAAVAGVAMLATVCVIHPGPARFTLAVGVVLLIGWAVGVHRPAPAAPPDGVTEALVEIEVAMLEMRSWATDREHDISTRVDRVTEMVADLTDQVR
jgi:hypothetical protein